MRYAIEGICLMLFFALCILLSILGVDGTIDFFLDLML